MKLQNRILFLVFCVALLAACAAVPQQATFSKEREQGLLWKIEIPGVQPSYLFGTIHSEDSRVLKLSEPVQTAFDQATSLALEIEFSPESGQYAFASMFFSDGRSLDKLVDDDTRNHVVRVMSRRGLPEHQILMMKPWAVFTMMNMPEPETGVYLDIKLYQSAAAQGKKLHGLETIEEQIATFDEMSIEDQLRILKHSLENEEEFSKVLDQTIDIYLSRDLTAMEALNEEFMSEMPPDIAEKFVHRLIDSRNRRMYKRMQPLIKSGGAFIAVGALHLPGESGIINNLRKNNITVSAIY